MKNTQSHLSNPNNDSKLHLIWVEKVQFIRCSDPLRIHSQRINASIFFLSEFFRFSMTITWSKYIPRNRKELVVDPTTVKSKRTHHQDQIPDIVNITKNLLRIWVTNQPNTKSQEQTTMTNITEHHTKQKRKDSNSKQSRIHLFVSWHTISINNLLKWSCEIVSLEVSWWFFFSSWLPHCDDMRKSELEQPSFILRHPDLCNHGTSWLILVLNNFEHIESIIDDKFLLNKNSISLILRTLVLTNGDNIFQLLFQSLLSHRTQLLCVIDSILNILYLLEYCLFVCLYVVSLCGKWLTYPCHLVQYRCTWLQYYYECCSGLDL